MKIEKKGTLLIVDDEPVLLDIMKFTLEGQADRVITAGNGLEALEVLKKEEVHCVVCDINMPVMNGVELIKKLRETNNNVTFIFYTGHGNHSLMLEAAKYGAFDFLNKPQLDGLEDAVARGLKQGFRLSSDIPEEEGDFMSEYQKLLLQVNDEEIK